ncbi:Serine/threonine protein kinase, partial [Globisporangium splendens]
MQKQQGEENEGDGELHAQPQRHPGECAPDERQRIAKRVYARFEVFYKQLLQAANAPTTQEVAMAKDLMNRFQEHYVRSRAFQQGIEHDTQHKGHSIVRASRHALNPRIDELLDILGVPDADVIRNWESILKRNRKEQHHGIDIGGILIKQSPKPSLPTTASLSDSKVHQNDIQTHPPWFLAVSEISFDKAETFGEGPVGTLHQGNWRGTPVTVKWLGYEKDHTLETPTSIPVSAFVREVTLWYRLRHPHIITLFGACHIDTRYFVSEYASNGTMREYLAQHNDDQLAWKMLYELSLAVQYLHSRNIVHNDLRCDNVLVGGDGKAKLTGFGLASIINEAEIVIDPNQIREAERWRKSPEYLLSGIASFESDIYSLGMCILEVLIGDASRRPHATEDSVLFQVGKDHLPNRKRLLRYEMLITKPQWQLVRKMTAAIPSQRVHISQITLELAQIVRQASAAKSSNGVDNSKLESSVLVTPEQTATEVSCKSLAPQSHTPTTADRARTTLSYAAESGDLEMCAFLIERGASVDLCDSSGRDPLSYATANGHTESVVLLTLLGANANKRDMDGRSPLSYAAEAGMTEIVQFLVYRGADVTEKDRFGRTPLSYAAESGHTESVQLLFDRGADVSDKDWFGRTPLLYAADAGNTEIVLLLVYRGADVKEKDRFGRSPLSYAAEAGRIESVQLLVNRGAYVNEKDWFGRSPLSYAAEAGITQIVQLLVNRGADVTEKDRHGRSPVWHAAVAGMTDIVRLLVDLGADLTEKDMNGRSPLSSAVDEKGSNGRTALSYAAQQGYGEIVLFAESWRITERYGHMNIVKTLIEVGADVDVRAPDGETPLISISRWDYAPGVQLLIEKCRSGVNPFATRSTARTPLLPGTLETMHELCTKTHEFAAVTTRVMQRLQDACSQLEQQGMIEVQSEALATLIPIVLAISSAISDFHEELDHLAALLQLSLQESDWKDQWLTDETNTTQSIHEKLVDDGALVDGLDNIHDKDRAAVWLVNTCENNALFGACHIESKPFFVYEYGKRLLDVLIEKQQSPWKYLYDAALGVQLLHQRSIVHGDLRCSNIVVGLDGVAKVGGLEYRMDHYYFWFDTEQAGWASPELLSGQVKSLSSDIYAFGMCILEAITLKRPWFPLELYGYYRNVRRRKLPDRPESFSDDQWDLVTKMCAYKSADRISIGYVVLQFKKFVETRNYLVLVAHDTHIEFPQLELNTIPVKLQTIRDRCQQLPESKWLVRDVWPALEFLFHTMVSQQIRPTDTVAEKYCAALRSLDRYLRTTLSEKSTAHAARSRQVAESHHVIYEELDRLLDMVHVSKSHPIRSWKRSEASIDQRILKDANCVKASAIPGAVSLKMFGLSRTELCDGRTGDEPQAVPTWFLPLRKLQFSSSSEIGQGAFGKVYKGVWLDTPVVVKFMGYEGDRDTISNELFLHEVRVWHRLKKHPHIVELYGACHVDKRYFVCEYASNGDLRDYLKRAGNDHLVWDKLYEVALGLAYMHGLSVVHNDLKCDNVLVGMDGKAKLIDFGLSAIVGDSEIMVDPKLMGAIHWKSPEYLAGGRPSFASDVYSFAMCILETVTGDIPWGSNAIGGVVKYRVQRGNIPPRPGTMNDKQWNLIALMTKQNPSERVRMTFVVDKLFEISEAEKSRAAAGPGVP